MEGKKSDMNKFSKNYQEIVSIERKLYILKQEYIKLNENIIDMDIKLLIDKKEEISFFYKTIKLLPEEILNKNFNQFLFLSIYGTSTEIYYFQNIISSMNKQFVHSSIKEGIDDILKTLVVDEGYLDYLYRNIVTLYIKLNECEYLNDFLITYCKNHENIDIFEIYEDYYCPIQPSCTKKA